MPHSKSHAGMITYNFHPPFRNIFCNLILLQNYNHPSIIVNCDWATRTTTLSYIWITPSSTQTSLLVYLGLKQSPANS